MQQTPRQNRIPEQQGVGQTLPPVPVGIDSLNAPPLPPGAMPTGTRLQVGKYQVIVHNFIAEGKKSSASFCILILINVTKVVSLMFTLLELKESQVM